METNDRTTYRDYPRLMLAAPASGTGKTLLTCGLLRLLQRKGMRPAAFKCGPDYIDPMFHRRVLGIPSRNLDTFFSPGQGTEVSCGNRGRDEKEPGCPEHVRDDSGADFADDFGPAFAEQPGPAFAEHTGPTFAEQPGPASAENSVREILVRAAGQTGADISVIEGVMGYFDGTGPSGMTASSFDLADQTQTPVILVVSARGMSRSVVPLVRGFAEYEKDQLRSGEEGRTRTGTQKPAGTGAEAVSLPNAVPPGGIRGVILNRISAGMYPLMKKWIEQDTDLRVIGYMPQEAGLTWESRHLGLLQPEEISGLQQQIDRLADRMEETIDLEALLDLARSAPALPAPAEAFCGRETGLTGDGDLIEEGPGPGSETETGGRSLSPRDLSASPVPRVAVARDEAFSFYYEDNLELLRECGADLIFFSPIHDKDLPAADGLLLGGGYPELHARELADNAAMRDRIRARAAEGMPVLAECGGFMYLQEGLELEGGRLPMCGVLPGVCRMTDRLVRFGYLELENRPFESRSFEDSLSENRDPKSAGPEDGERGPEADGTGKSAYLLPGHHIRGHEFHYFDSTCNGDACRACKPGRRRSWDCMVSQGNIMAGFPHLYYRSDPAFAQAFVDRCREFMEKKEKTGDPV